MSALTVNPTHCPFCQGFYDAQQSGEAWDPTALEVERAHPEYSSGDVAQYINGVLDGYDNDWFRMSAHAGGTA